MFDRLYKSENKLTTKKDEPNEIAKLDIGRVRDVRNILRLKYQGKSNIQKIFSKYDVEEKGFVSAADICAKAKEFGVALTSNEAQLLIQSAKDNK